MLSSLQDSISGHKGTIEVTIKRHISISFTAGDISVVKPSPSNHLHPPGTSFLSAGRWRSPSVVEGLRLLTGWRSFRSSWRLLHILKSFVILLGLLSFLHCLKAFFTRFSKSFAILLGLLGFFLYLQVQLLLLALQIFLRISADISKNVCCEGLASIW